MRHFLGRAWLIAASLLILLNTVACTGAANFFGVEQLTAPTALATPIVHNDALPTDAPPVQIPIATVADSPAEQLPPAPAPNIFGAALQTISPESGLQLMIEAGSAWTRRDFPWAAVEPEEGLRQWENVADLDAELIAAAQNNMQVVLILGSSPEWAMDLNHPLCGGRITQDKFTALANFAHDLVARYSQPPFNIIYYELWNEPEVYSFLGCWGEPSDPLGYYGGYYYGQMLMVVYPEMKAANPVVQVMVGGLLLDCNPDLHILNGDGSPKDCSMTDFFTGILASTRGQAFDGVSFHAYDYYAGGLGKYSNANFAASWDTTGPATLMKTKYLREKMADYGVTNKVLMNTEIALLCNGPLCQTDEFEATKAYYLVQAYAAGLADGYTANIWYSVFGDRNSGLLNSNLEHFPAYNSFKFTQSMLNGLRFAAQPNAGDGVKAYEFTNGDKIVVILWSSDGENHTVILTIGPQTIFRMDMSGNAIPEPATKELNIGIAPLFVILD